MRRILSLLTMAMLLTGCESPNTPAKLPVGAKFEIFTIAATDASNTTQAIDATTGDPLFLQSPSIITTTDIDTVAHAVGYITHADGSRTEGNAPCLDIKLTAQGAAKMAAATAKPTGNPIAVVVNGKVISTPQLHSQIHGSLQVSGDPNDQNFKSAVDALTKR